MSERNIEGLKLKCYSDTLIIFFDFVFYWIENDKYNIQSGLLQEDRAN